VEQVFLLVVGLEWVQAALQLTQLLAQVAVDL
jgi:hypothetical protein